MFAQEFDASGPFDWARKRGGGHHGGWKGEAFGAFRAGRGMMEPAILGALSERPMHGYEIITYMEEKSHGMWRPSPGSVYPTLQLLEEKGDVKASEENGKKIYALTDQGKVRADEFKHLRERLQEDFGSRFKHGRDSRKQLGDMMHLMRDIYRKGSAEQNAALKEAIDHFHARLKQINEGEL